MATIGHRTPAYRLLMGGTDLSPTIRPRLIRLTLTSQRGEEADQLDIELSDHDGALQLPRRGVILTLAIGWQGSALVDKGSFTVDEVEHAGTPDTLTIRARSASLSKPLRTQRDQSWHETTLGYILATIADRHQLDPRVDTALASIAVDHIDQSSESDIAFITRLSRLYDAVATVKSGRLLFLPIIGTTTSSGADLPTIKITRQSGDQHRYLEADRDSYSGVRAYWHDPARASRRGVLVGISGNAKVLRETFASETDARHAAVAEWQRIQRGAATFNITMAEGDPAVEAQSPIALEGFKQEITAQTWRCVQVVDSITGDDGFTTQIEAEVYGAKATEIGEAHDIDLSDDASSNPES
jgi:phage protein D